MAATGVELLLTRAAERAAGRTTRAAYMVRSLLFSETLPSSAKTGDRLPCTLR